MHAQAASSITDVSGCLLFVPPVFCTVGVSMT